MSIHIGPFLVSALASLAFAANGTEQTQPPSSPDLIAGATPTVAANRIAAIVNMRDDHTGGAAGFSPPTAR